MELMGFARFEMNPFKNDIDFPVFNFNFLSGMEGLQCVFIIVKYKHNFAFINVLKFFQIWKNFNQFFITKFDSKVFNFKLGLYNFPF